MYGVCSSHFKEYFHNARHNSAPFLMGTPSLTIIAGNVNMNKSVQNTIEYFQYTKVVTDIQSFPVEHKLKAH